MHLKYHNNFDYRKNPKTPYWAQCRVQDGAGSGISGLYLWAGQKKSYMLITKLIRLSQGALTKACMLTGTHPRIPPEQLSVSHITQYQFWKVTVPLRLLWGYSVGTLQLLRMWSSFLAFCHCSIRDYPHSINSGSAACSFHSDTLYMRPK